MSLEKIAALPKTIYYNLKIFGWGGVKLPIIFSHKVIIHGIRRGCIEIKNLQKNRIYIGFGGTIGVEPNKNTVLSFGPSAVLIINGTAQIAAGSVFRIDAGAIRLGESFSCNRNCFISCSKEITFGSYCLLGWNVNIRDSDGHNLIKDGNRCEKEKAVSIGNHVWIAANVDILKGVTIPSNCVIGYRSCVTNNFKEKDCLIAGYPARVIRKNISWEK